MRKLKIGILAGIALLMFVATSQATNRAIMVDASTGIQTTTGVSTVVVKEKVQIGAGSSGVTFFKTGYIPIADDILVIDNSGSQVTGWPNPIDTSYSAGGNPIYSFQGIVTGYAFASWVSEYQTPGASVTLDLSACKTHVVNLDTSGTSLFITNPPTTGGLVYYVAKFVQDSTGSRSATWPSSVISGVTHDYAFPSGVSPTFTARASGYDIFTIIYGLSGATLEVIPGALDLK